MFCIILYCEPHFRYCTVPCTSCSTLYCTLCITFCIVLYCVPHVQYGTLLCVPHVPLRYCTVPCVSRLVSYCTLCFTFGVVLYRVPHVWYHTVPQVLFGIVLYPVPHVWYCTVPCASRLVSYCTLCLMFGPSCYMNELLLMRSAILHVCFYSQVRLHMHRRYKLRTMFGLSILNRVLCIIVCLILVDL